MLQRAVNSQTHRFGRKRMASIISRTQPPHALGAGDMMKTCSLGPDLGYADITPTAAVAIGNLVAERPLELLG